MGDSDIEQLAAQLGRPVRSLVAFECLTPEQLAFLNQAIDEACRRERSAVDAVPVEALPRPLRGLLLRLLGWRRT